MTWSPRENDEFFGEPQEQDPDPPAAPVAWVARCHQDTMDTIAGQISGGSLTERGPFECAAPDVWECVPVYLGAAP